MPVLTIPFRADEGLIVQAPITLGRPEIARRRRAKLPIPQPVTVAALLDRGRRERVLILLS